MLDLCVMYLCVIWWIQHAGSVCYLVDPACWICVLSGGSGVPSDVLAGTLELSAICVPSGVMDPVCHLERWIRRAI